MIEDEAPPPAEAWPTVPWPAAPVLAETPLEVLLPGLKLGKRWPRAKPGGQEFRLWQGLAIAFGVHIDAVLVAIAISALHLHPKPPPPEAPPISVTMVETEPAGNTQAPVFQHHAAAPPPAPPAPVHAPAKPAVAQIPLAKPAPDGTLPPPAPPRPAVVAKAAPPAPKPAPPAPAKPSVQPPALVQGAKTPVVKTVTTSQGITRPAKAYDGTTVFYSMYARQQGQEGQVRLSVVVEANGTLGAVTVVGSSGYPVLDNVARSSVMTWRFQPALKNGVPVVSTLPLVFKFALQ